MTGLEALAAAAATAASSVPSWLPVAASVASGGLAFAQGQQQAKVAKATGEFNAKELEKAAAEERAAAARKAYERRQQTNRVLSRQRAVGAAGGAGTDNEGFIDIAGDTASRGEYLSDLEIASGANQAAGLENKAAMSRFKGAADASAAKAKGVSALVGAAFDVAGHGLKKAPVAKGGSDYDLIDFDANDSGWSTEVYKKKPRGRYY
jgi:hypothetical protein